jgi:hypothetical protein
MHATRVLACNVDVVDAKGVVDEEECISFSLQEQAEVNNLIGNLELQVGSITGRGRELLFTALLENREGVFACCREAKKRGHKPLALLIRMLADGDHRAYTPEPEPEACYH